jgi:beta-fructofuranosidase
VKKVYLFSTVLFVIGIVLWMPSIAQNQDRNVMNLDGDAHRPGFHFLPPANWMNDPNGLIYWKGEVHLFYQYNPNGAFWGTMHWGHAVSSDMVHWTHWPIALAPTPGGPDQDGVFSGCAVDNRGIPTLVFTGTNPEVQCLATSQDGLRSWEKFPGNPVISGPPPGLETTGFRDPCVWQEDGKWMMALGSGFKGAGGAVLLYESADLIHWKYLNPLLTGNPEETGTVWECPNFFPLRDKFVLIVSPIPLSKSIYFVGRYRDHKFIPETKGSLDDGGHYYAPQTFLDGQKRRIIFGWSWEGRSEKAQRKAGWAGIQSLPRLLTLRRDDKLEMQPVPELLTLRGKHSQWVNLVVEPSAHSSADIIRGNALEILLELDLSKSSRFGFKMFCSADEKEQTVVAYGRKNGKLTVDREHSSLDPECSKTLFSAELNPKDGEPLKLHIFLDRSVIEIFANDTICLTSRVYPTRTDSLGVKLFSEGGRALVKSLDTWEMKSTRQLSEK